MEKYIGDDIVTLCLAGLRFIKKEDHRYGGMPEKYGLEWNYKGVDSSILYEDKKARDAMYAKAQKALMMPG